MSTSPATVGRADAFGSVLLGSPDQTPRRLRIRTQLLLTALLVTTNVVGAVIVVVLTAVVVPPVELTHASALGLAIAAPSYLVLAIVVGGVWGTTGTLRALRWASRGEEPTAAERHTALRLPWRLTLLQASLWAGAFVLFTTLSAVLQPALVLGTCFTVAIAGLVVSAIAYLLSEFALRPVSARALSGASSTERISVVGVRRRLLLFWALGTAAPVTGLVVTAVVFLVDDQMTPQRLAGIVLTLAGVVLVFGLLVTALTARSVVSPITSVRRALMRVGEGDFDVEISVYDGTELGLLQAGFNQMARGLAERERLRDVFGRHVGREVAAAAAGGKVELGGETRTVTVLFVDVVGSTTYADEREAAEVVETLNRFFGVIVSEVSGAGGLVNKFMGDAVLAVFGAPVDLEDHAGAALRAGRGIARRLGEEVGEIKAGIGIATGPAVAGNVGAESRYEYTVIGDSVNSAARLCDLSKDPPEGLEEHQPMLLAAWSSLEAATVEEREHWVAAGSATLRGRSEPTRLATLRTP